MVQVEKHLEYETARDVYCTEQITKEQTQRQAHRHGDCATSSTNAQKARVSYLKMTRVEFLICLDAVIVLGGKKDEEIKKRLSRKALEKVVKKSSKPSKELSRRISKERSKSAPVNTAEATPKVSSQDASKETLSNPPGAPYHKTSKERQEVEDMSPGTHARKTLSGSSEVPLSDQSLEVVHSSTSLYSVRKLCRCFQELSE
ncbi:unnamed protein product [Toxocara canis]|uniref:TPX2 domain-containing protein n=1 Tax=Toxocara canis TaxID=6265 RepID=A0A183USH1_TOXCA|nr:unnamed protein product [Toxocara canis]